MRKISVLDVTLRDGGCVNNFEFGADYMRSILSALELSNVDFVEVGYIDEKKGSSAGRTQYIDEQVIPSALQLKKKNGLVYLAMMDYGKFTPINLAIYDGKGIDGVRLAFHKKDWRDAIGMCRIILDKGYKLFVQPMLTLHYDDRELVELIEAVNDVIPDASAFYLVDSFGEMRGSDLNRLVGLVDHNLTANMSMGLHSHNNLQLSYSLAMTLMAYPTNRNVIIDSSIMGMGKGAGNLCTELLLEHMNLYYGASYKISSILEVIDRVVKVLHQESPWGYSVEYYLSSINHCTPSYAGYFYNKHMLTIEQVGELLGMIDKSKKNSFDKEYAQELYLDYCSNVKYDDSRAVEKLRTAIEGKQVLVIAPGKSIDKFSEKIRDLIGRSDVVSIGLNNFKFKTDYVLITRQDMLIKDCPVHKEQLIVLSRKKREMFNAGMVLDYDKWIYVCDEVYDSSAVIAFRLVCALGASAVLLAGLDGFSASVNDNYCDKVLRRSITESEVVKRNLFYTAYIKQMSQKIDVDFVTPSLYQNA